MRKLRVRSLGLLMAMCMLASMFAGGALTAVGENAGMDIYGMTVNDLVSPIGIDKVPHFSWKLQSDVIGQKQTAYRLVVAADEAFSAVVWDTGKVADSDTTDIVYAGAALSDCTRYYWKVTVYDKNGDAIRSDAAWFETAFLNGSLLDGASWIEVGSPAVGEGAAAYTTNYTVELDVVSVSGAVGVLFGGKRNTTGSAAMWQIQDKGTYFRVVPHKWLAAVSGAAVEFGRENYAALKADGFRLKIAVNDDEITTYVNGEAVSVVTTAQLGYVPTLGFVGLRQATNENCTIDNLVITDYARHAWGDVLENYDFSSLPPTYDSDGQGTPQIVNEQFVVDEADGWFGICYFVENLASSDLRYTVDVDVVDVTDTIGILMSPQATSLSNMLLWQIADKDTYYQIKPHYYSGGWKAFSAVSFATGEGEYAALSDGFHVTLEVTDNRIKAYVNGKLISDQHKSAFNNITPTLKYVVPCTLGTDLGGSLDNLKITDWSYLEEGQVLRFFDFEDPSIFAAGATYALQSGSTVANGVYTSNKISGSFEWFNKVALERESVVVMQPVNVHYAYEADVSCTAVAASLLFNMTDAKNGLMWQIVRSSAAVKIRPHKIVNNRYTAYSDIDITDLVSPAALDGEVHFRIEVADNVINTYVNGVLVNNFETAQLGTDIFLGKFGTRIAAGEAFTLNNLKAVDYIDSEEGEVLFAYDCDTFNPFFRGKLTDGKVAFDTSDSKTAGIYMVHAGADTFRKEFTAEKTIANARLYITSYGLFNAYLNGARVGNKDADGETVYEEMMPGWTEEDDRSCYYTFDVTDLLGTGANTLTVGINNGWESVASERSNDPTENFKLLAKLQITYADGTAKTVVTDDTWTTACIGPIRLGEVYHGEYYDATVDTAFRQNGFDDSKWRQAKTVTFATQVSAREGGSIYVRKGLRRTPQTVTVYDGVTDAVPGTQYGKIRVSAAYGDEAFSLKAGETAVVDFGQNFAGFENITVSGARGTVVRIRHAEMLNDTMGLVSRGNDGAEGSVYTANLRTAVATSHYVLSGDGSENYRPTATYYGFRYMEITATADITVEKVRGEVATSVTMDTGSFETSDALLNRLYLNTVWGQYSNYFGQATDCPQRDERLGYSGDTQVFVGTAMYNAQVKAFLRNFMQTLVEGQASDGAYGNTMPNQTAAGSVWAGVAGWADAGILVPYRYYKQYGDASILSDYYASMTKYMDYLNSMDLRVGLQFGDWLSYATNDTQMKQFLSYVYTVWDTQMMQEISAVLGKTDDVAKWETMEQKYLALARPLYLDENGDLSMTQQTALLFALKVGLYENEAAYARGKDALVAAIVSNGGKLNTGFLGTSIIMETLVEIGETDLAYTLLFQDQDPSWLYSVKQGATTTWERWNSYTLENGFGAVSMNSFNHYAYGCVGEFMYNTVLGIRPDGAGYDRVLLTPVPTDNLTYAKGSYESVNGKIESAWEKAENGSYVYTVRIPANTTGTVKLQQAVAGAFAINGTNAADATMEKDGAVFVGNENGCAVFAITSGTFRFTFDKYPLLTAAENETPEGFTFDGTADLTDAFHLYYNREGVYNSRTNEDNGDTADTYLGTTAYDSNWVLSDGWLQRNTAKKTGEIFRKIDSLVPLNSAGEEVRLADFETTFDVRFDTASYGAAILGFRQVTPGKFTNKYYGIYTGQGVVAIGQSGITIAAGTDIVSSSTDATHDMYNHWQTETFSESLPDTVSVKVQVIGKHCKVWIYRYKTTDVLKRYDEEIPDTGTGALAYGVSTTVHSIGNMHLTALDKDGNAVDLLTPQTDSETELAYHGGIIRVTDTEKTENGYRYTVAIDPMTGYQLAAAGFYAQDENGTKTAPQRVGWRQGGDGNAFTVETGSRGGVLHASFVSNKETTGNIAPIGLSVNPKKQGLRFIHRAYMREDNGTYYVWVGGEEKEVADYGVLMGAASVIGTNELTLEFSQQLPQIRCISVKNRNVYYDYCTGYADMAVTVVGLQAVTGGMDMDLTSRAYAQLTDGTVLYGSACTSSYNAAK